MGKLEDIAKEVTPKLAEKLAGPLQEQAMQFVFKRLKVKSKEEAEEKLSTDTNALPQLRMAQQDLEGAIDGKLPDSKRKDWPQIVISLIYNVGYFAVLGVFIAVMFNSGIILDEWVKGVIGTLLGSLTSSLNSANGYWFTSSAGSAAKNEIIAKNGKS